MRNNRYTPFALLVGALALLLAAPVQAQYGTGEVINVPYASSPIEIDGVDDDADWDLATFIDLVNVYEAWGPGDPDNVQVEANARLLWREGVLYVFMYVEQLDHDLYFNPGPEWWKGTSAIIGVDLTHAGDDQVDDSWGGWVHNAPNLGPVAYKISAEHPQTFTLNWGFDDAPNPIVEGYIDGVLVVHENNRSYTIEMAIYGEEIASGEQIGFNAAGSIGSDPPGEEWGWFAYSVCQLDANCQWAGGLMAHAGGYVSLNFTGGPGEGYGTGVVQQVPRAKGDITLDGNANEAAWDNAVEIDLTENWNGGFYGWGSDIPDIFSTARLLWDDGVLYLFLQAQHPFELFFNDDLDQGAQGPWDGNTFLVGVDMTHEGDDQIDNSWSGWPWNAPDQGPTTYKINPMHGGITANWGFPFDDHPDGLDPVAAGYVDGAFFIDEDAQEWGLEMAIYGDAISLNNMIGFNAGGSAAAQEACDNTPECVYAWYSWQAISQTSAGGDVMRVAASFASLHFVEAISTEGGAGAAGVFAVRENFPNPFRSATTVVYELERDAAVELVLFDVLGRRIALLDEGPRAAGAHHVRVDGSDLASGMYIVRLNVDGQSAATHMMMRVK